MPDQTRVTAVLGAMAHLRRHLIEILPALLLAGVLMAPGVLIAGTDEIMPELPGQECLTPSILDPVLIGEGLAPYAGRVTAVIVTAAEGRSLQVTIRRPGSLYRIEAPLYPNPPIECDELHEIVMQTIAYDVGELPTPLMLHDRTLTLDALGGLGWTSVVPAASAGLSFSARPGRRTEGIVALEGGLSLRATVDSTKTREGSALILLALTAPVGIQLKPATGGGSLSLRVAPGAEAVALRYANEPDPGLFAQDYMVIPCLGLEGTARVHLSPSVALDASLVSERRLEDAGAGPPAGTRAIDLPTERYFLIGLSWIRKFPDQDRP